MTDLIDRMRSEYQEMPGMRLTPWQASRLWHLDVPTVEDALRRLVENGVLVRTRDGAYLLRSVA